MSDGAQVLAARVEDLEAKATAARVIAWLVERGVIEPMPTDSALGALGHRPGPNALDVVVKQKKGVTDFRSLLTNGLHVEHSARPTLVTGGDEMPTFACPACEEEIEADAVFPLLDAIPNLFTAPPQLDCAACSAQFAVADLTVTEGAAFANLTLRFWNWWPLEPTFIEELTEKVGAEMHVLYERV